MKSLSAMSVDELPAPVDELMKLQLMPPAVIGLARRLVCQSVMWVLQYWRFWSSS